MKIDPTALGQVNDASTGELTKLAMLRRALDYVSDAIAILRTAKHNEPTTIAYANRAFADLFSSVPGDLAGRAWSVLHGPLTDAATLARIRSAATANKPTDETAYLYGRDGTARFVELRERSIDGEHRVLSVHDLTLVRATQESLSDANIKLHSLLANNSESILTIDRYGSCLDANAAAETLFGYEREELLGFGFLKATQTSFFPDGTLFPARLSGAGTWEFPATYRHRDGRSINVECTAVPMILHGVTEGAYLILKDVTEEGRLARLVAEHARRTHALYLISAAESSTDAKQIDAALQLVLEAFDMRFGYVGEVLDGAIHIRNVAGERTLAVGDRIELERTYVERTLAYGDVLALDDLADPVNKKTGAPDYPDWHDYISAPLTIDGRPYGATGFLSREIVAFNEFDRDFVRLVATLISAALERQLQKQRLDRLAYYDMLTGLPNRAKFMQDLEAVIGDASRNQRSFALHFIDLDGFKHVNDSSGHAVGDLALQEAARRLRQALRHAGDVPARLGGDEFVLLQADVDHPGDAETVGRRIVALLCQPYVLGDHTFDLSASVGIALFPDDGHDAKTLLRNADVALYRAKTKGKNRIETIR